MCLLCQKRVLYLNVINLGLVEHQAFVLGTLTFRLDNLHWPRVTIMPELSIQWHTKQFRTDCQQDITKFKVGTGLIVRLLNVMIW